MRQIYLIFIFLLLVGCEVDTAEHYRTVATFVPTLSTLGSGADTRVDNTQWTGTDVVGIGMSNTQGTLPGAFSKYTALSPGSSTVLTPGTPADALYFITAQMQYFTAFCPYDEMKHTPSAGTVSYTLTDQNTAAKMEAVDLVYANNGTGSKASPTVTLGFTHKLSKLTVNVIDGRTAHPATTVGLTIKSVPTTATCALATGAITASGTGDITPLVSTAAGEFPFTATAIVAPHAASAGALLFTINDGISYEFTYKFTDLDPNFEFKSGTAYALTFTLKDNKELIVGETTIADWNSGNIVWDFTGNSLTAPTEVTHYKEASTGNTMVIKTNHTGTPDLTYNSLSWLTEAVLTQTKADSPYEWTLTYNVAATSANRTGTIDIAVGGMKVSTTVTQKGTSYPAPYVDGNTNCFIVTPGMAIKFPLSRPISQSTAAPDAVFTVERLWDDAAGGAVSSVSVDGTGSNATITVVASSNPGNALVAAKVGTTIVWSYHIWVTDYNPYAATYTNTFNTNNGGKNFVFMDRNLGATAAGTGSGIGKGLFYQWGRKDPFPATLAPDAIQPGGGTFKAEATNETKGTIAYAIQNPHIFLHCAASPYDWYHGGGAAVGNRNNELWGHSGGKSVYDPCPVGWRVPKNYNDAYSGSVTKSPWYGFSTAASDTETGNKPPQNLSPADFSNGYTWGTNAAYPAAGYRNRDNGTLSNVGTSGNYWSASPYSSSSVNATYLSFNGSSVNVYYDNDRAYGFSVRCVQE